MSKTDFGYIPLNIANGIREFSVANPGKIAIIDGNRSISYRELDIRSSQVANFFISKGFKKGDRVAVISGNRMEYPEIVAGLSKAGLIAVLVKVNQKGISDFENFKIHLTASLIISILFASIYYFFNIKPRIRDRNIKLKEEEALKELTKKGRDDVALNNKNFIKNGGKLIIPIPKLKVISKKNLNEY